MDLVEKAARRLAEAHMSGRPWEEWPWNRRQGFLDDARDVVLEVCAYIREQELAGVPACDVIDTLEHDCAL